MVVDKKLNEILGEKTTGLAVDVYRNKGQVVAMTFWSDGPEPLAFFKAIDGHEGLVRSALLGDDDVPASDKRDSLLDQRLAGADMAANRLVSVKLTDGVGKVFDYSSTPLEKSSDVNFIPLTESLSSALSRLEGGALQDAASMLRAISREWQERNIDFSDNHPAKNIGIVAAAIAADVLAGKPGVTHALQSYLTQISEHLPEFRIVLIDETHQWNDDGLVSRAGKIWGAYLYDANQSVYLAEITPSYELNYLYSSAEGELPEDDLDTLLIHGGPEDGSIYMHCAGIDAIDWSRKYACGKPADSSAETYRQLLDAEIEHYGANYCIDVPVAMNDEMAARTALTLIEHARDNSVEVASLVGGMTAGAQQQVKAFQADASLETALGSFLNGLNARREFSRELGTENVTLESAQMASRFNTEIIEQFETISRIGEQFGQRTVADLYYLQTAILRGGEIDVWPQSSIMDVVKLLPSSEKWATHTKPCNKFGEPAPRQDVSDATSLMR